MSTILYSFCALDSVHISIVFIELNICCLHEMLCVCVVQAQGLYNAIMCVTSSCFYPWQPPTWSPPHLLKRYYPIDYVWFLVSTLHSVEWNCIWFLSQVVQFERWRLSSCARCRCYASIELNLSCTKSPALLQNKEEAAHHLSRMLFLALACGVGLLIGTLVFVTPLLQGNIILEPSCCF